MKSIRLGVNIDHIATLRQVRGGSTSYPDILDLTQKIIAAGADQITLHLREDRRHIQESDLAALAQKISVPLNLEMAPTLTMRKIALKYKPDWCCFVPEKRQELTTEGGLNVKRSAMNIEKIIDPLREMGIETSMFIEPSLEQVQWSAKVGADAVEFHTGRWVQLQGAARKREWKRLQEAAALANDLSLHVHAGHGLDFKTTRLVRGLRHLEEVNIGHSIICYSLEYGLVKTVRMMRKILQGTP